MMKMPSPLSGIKSPFGRMRFSIISTLFANNEAGVWYDPSDLSTLFQDTAGTTPVTTAGQTVGLMLDKSKGLVLGPELFANQPSVLDNSGGGATVIHTAATRTVQVTVAGSNTSYPRLQIGFGGITGRRYVVSGRIDGDRSLVNLVRLALAGTANSLAYNSSTGIFSGIQETGASPSIEFLVNGTQLGTVTIAALSIRELAGNHATQATAASRPTYGIVPFGGRRNLLTFSEQFDNAVWGKSNATVTTNVATAPDGTTTADFLVENTANTSHWFGGGPTPTFLWPDNTSYTASVYVKAAGRSFFWLESVTKTPTFPQVFFDLENGQVTNTYNGATGSIQAVGDGWYRCTLTANSLTGTFSPNIIFGPAINGSAKTYTGNGTSGVYVWGAQLELGSTATAYQRVTTQYDVTEAGVPPVAYLAFDGVDDSMVTPTITPSIDKVQVFAGVRKLSDAAQGQIVELSASVSSNNGVFDLISAASAKTYSFRSKGTVASIATTSASYSSPITNVLTGLGDISGDIATIRVNGTQAAQSATDQGTGNYLAYPLYIGRRGGTSVPFNGQLYSLVTRFGENLEANDIANTETYVASKTGVTL